MEVFSHIVFQRPTPSDIQCEYLVVGAGVSGITIAQKLSENGKNVWLLGSPYESQIAKAGALENINTIPAGTNGLDHIELMIDLAKKKGVNHKTSLCTGIETGAEILVKTKHQKFIAKKVVIATGAKQPRLNFEGEENFYPGGGISDCAVCDGRLYQGKDIAVVGNHEYTKRAAQFMKQHANQVYLLWLNGPVDFTIGNVTIFTDVTGMVAHGKKFLENISFQSKGTNQNITISGLFVEGAPKPASGFLQGSGIDLDDKSYIKVNEGFETNIHNIWAIGDITGKSKSFDEAYHHAIKLFEKISA